MLLRVKPNVGAPATMKITIQELPPWMSDQRTADLAAVSRPTVRRWIREGLIEAYRPRDAGSARVLVDTKSLLLMLGVPMA